MTSASSAQRSRTGSGALSASQLAVGDSITVVLVDDLTRTQIVQYAGASGDFNPLHSDERFATEVAGYPSIFAHGMLTMGMTATMLTDWVGDGRLTEFGVRFLNQVWPGDRLTGVAEVTELRSDDTGNLVDIAVTVTNAAGAKVVTGTATARIDP